MAETPVIEVETRSNRFGFGFLKRPIFFSCPDYFYSD
jgi:hypothetical protein